MRRTSRVAAQVAFVLGLGLGIIAVAGCRKGTPDGLPPATEWQAAVEAAPDTPRFKPPRGMGGGQSNPHAGLDMSDPHAGIDMSDPSDPHAGLDVTKLGLEGPDPDRAIDPRHRIAGKVIIDPRAKDRAKPGTSVFLIVKRAGPDGTPSGSPLAVDKVSWSSDGVAFELTDAQAMLAGTELRGDVIVSARYDQDSDALSKEPGDITGQVRVTVPADNVKLSLDTVLP